MIVAVMFFLVIVFRWISSGFANASDKCLAFLRLFVTRLINSALLLCLSLGLLVTACSNAGVAFNSNPVVLEPVSMDRGDASQALVDSGSLEDAMLGSGL